jgi:broad specificity phosphatase PhoE
MAQVIWLVRHGSRLDFVDPEWYVTARRPYDPPLSAEGVGQAQALGRRLRGERVAHLFASPFLRAVETAHYVAEALDLPIKIEAGFSEWLNPEWFSSPPERLSVEALRERFPRVDGNYASRVPASYPETADEALRRAGEAARLLSQECEGNVVIVGHGASVVGAAWGLLESRPEVHAAFCSLVKVSCQAGKWVLELAGDTAHLERTESTLRFH